MSKTLEDILKKNEGFRNDGYGGGGSDSIIEIVEFETFELCNTDIFESFIKLHKINLLKDFIEDDFQIILENQEALRDFIWEYKHEYLEAIKKFILAEFKETDICGIWLTDEESVKKHYLCSDISYSKYHIPQDAKIIPISDIGDQGVLFATDVNPAFWEIENICV